MDRKTMVVTFAIWGVVAVAGRAYINTVYWGPACNVHGYCAEPHTAYIDDGRIASLTAASSNIDDSFTYKSIQPWFYLPR